MAARLMMVSEFIKSRSVTIGFLTIRGLALVFAFQNAVYVR